MLRLMLLFYTGTGSREPQTHIGFIVPTYLQVRQIYICLCDGGEAF